MDFYKKNWKFISVFPACLVIEFKNYSVKRYKYRVKARINTNIDTLFDLVLSILADAIFSNKLSHL